MLKDILAAHFAAYPMTQPQDAVKLIYQHVFGPGHLIRNEEKSLDMLRREMATLSPASGTLYEPIGNGLCRLHLAPCLEKGISPEEINRLLCDAARAVRGDDREFQAGLRMLEEMAEEEETPFPAVALDIFLMEYRGRKCPDVHHSDPYRAAYRPAYRVVFQKKLKDFLARKRGTGKE